VSHKILIVELSWYPYLLDSIPQKPRIIEKRKKLEIEFERMRDLFPFFPPYTEGFLGTDKNERSWI